MMLFVMIAKHWNKLIKQTSLCQKRLNTLIWWIIENTDSNSEEDAQFDDEDDQGQTNDSDDQMKMKSRNVVTCGVMVTWSGLNMPGFGILLKYVVWMMYPVICNIGFLYKIKFLLNGLERTTSCQSVHLRLMFFMKT